MKIRNAEIDDVGCIHDIYVYYVLNGIATFEEVLPSIEDMKER
jgi:L-amino acid N-acyltransferase YncA